MKLSRRGMLTLAGASVALGHAMTQAPAPPPVSAAAASPDPLTAAREDNRRSAESLAKFEIPMSTEPAFVFRP
jgi:hypothetical protein